MTPFDRQRRISEPVLRDLVDFLIEAGVDGLFPCSSSGEFARLTDAERRLVIKTVVEQARGRVPVTPGVGAPGVDQAIIYAQEALSLGCDGVVLCPPYYYRNLPQESVLRHYEIVADAVAVPIIVYSIPTYCCPITPESVAVLCREYPHVVGIKDSSCNMVTFGHLLDLTAEAREEFSVLTGAEEMLYPSLVMGGSGGMLISANVVPELLLEIVRCANSGAHIQARRLQRSLLKLTRAMGAVPFPAGYKLGLEARGFPAGGDRHPMGPAGERLREASRPVVKALVWQVLDEAALGPSHRVERC
jgi:N-acetylneuraminate lyase/4-hydroxy-tetrahydrodipicolinate synthase